MLQNLDHPEKSIIFRSFEGKMIEVNYDSKKDINFMGTICQQTQYLHDVQKNFYIIGAFGYFGLQGNCVNRLILHKGTNFAQNGKKWLGGAGGGPFMIKDSEDNPCFGQDDPDCPYLP